MRKLSWCGHCTWMHWRKSFQRAGNICNFRTWSCMLILSLMTHMLFQSNCICLHAFDCNHLFIVYFFLNVTLDHLTMIYSVWLPRFPVILGHAYAKLIETGALLQKRWVFHVTRLLRHLTFKLVFVSRIWSLSFFDTWTVVSMIFLIG